MEKKFLWVGLTLLAVVLLAVAVTIFVVTTNDHLRGSAIDPPAPAADFSLTDQNGRTVSLSDYHGRYVLLFFGYTHCTTECPATMAVLKQVYADLGDQASKVQVLFLSTDPARDTTQAMGTFVDRFNPAFVGLTGTQADLQKVWLDYGVTVLDSGETHSTFVYLIDPAGNLRLTYASPTSPDDILADLRLLFRKE
jgi:protein SCO1/2